MELGTSPKEMTTGFGDSNGTQFFVSILCIYTFKSPPPFTLPVTFLFINTIGDLFSVRPSSCLYINVVYGSSLWTNYGQTIYSQTSFVDSLII